MPAAPCRPLPVEVAWIGIIIELANAQDLGKKVGKCDVSGDDSVARRGSWQVCRQRLGDGTLTMILHVETCKLWETDHVLRRLPARVSVRQLRS
jgi:hypothetical protein